MKTTPSPQRTLGAWLAQNADVPIIHISREIGDPGGQLGRWASGDRSTLPLRLKLHLADYTSIPVRKLLDENETAMLEQAVRLMQTEGGK